MWTLLLTSNEIKQELNTIPVLQVSQGEQCSDILGA